MRLHANYACAISTRVNLNLLCVAQNGVVLELRYYDESDIVLCVK